MDRGFKTKVGPVFDKSFADVNCMQCGDVYKRQVYKVYYTNI